MRIAAGAATLDGVIRANSPDTGLAAPVRGSGGGVMLNVGTLAGGGSISAKAAPASALRLPASGGGGRVAICYGVNNGFDTLVGKVRAHGGGVIPAAVGTVYLNEAGGQGVLRIDNHGMAVGGWTPLGQPTDTVFQVETLVISGTNVVAAPEHQMPVQANNVTIQTGGVLTHQAATTNQEYSLN